MEPLYQHTVDGQEVGQEDLNLLGEEAALAEDRLLAELLRMKPYPGPQKGILRTGYHSDTYTLHPDVVIPYSGGGTTLRVYPFRAVIGTRASAETKEWLTDIRSAFFSSNGSQLEHTLALSSTASNNRWDLVYAAVAIDVDQAAVDRYVKDADGVVALQSISTRKLTTVTVAVVQGTENASPAKPSLPADGGGVYYIPLAYVYLPHPFVSGTTEILASRICTVAPVLVLSDFVGGSALRPTNKLYEDGTVLDTAWGTDGRPEAYLPPTMVGSERRFFGLNFQASSRSIPLSATTTIDDSIDWRNRILKVTRWQCPAASTAGLMAGDATAPTRETGASPTVTTLMQHTVTNGYDICLDATGSGSSLSLEVDDSSGVLKAVVGATDPAITVYYWIEATGQFTNV